MKAAFMIPLLLFQLCFSFVGGTAKPKTLLQPPEAAAPPLWVRARGNCPMTCSQHRMVAVTGGRTLQNAEPSPNSYLCGVPYDYQTSWMPNSGLFYGFRVGDECQTTPSISSGHHYCGCLPRAGYAKWADPPAGGWSGPLPAGVCPSGYLPSHASSPVCRHKADAAVYLGKAIRDTVLNKNFCSFAGGSGAVKEESFEVLCIRETFQYAAEF